MARKPIYYKSTITIFNPAEYVNINVDNLPLVEPDFVFLLILLLIYLFNYYF